VELAVVDPSPSDHDNVVVIPGRLLAAKKSVADPRLPFEVKPEAFFPNSELLGPAQAGNAADIRATAGIGKDSKITVRNIPRFSGVGGEAQRQDLASAYVSLRAGGKPLGTYLVSQRLNPERVTVDGKTYLI